MFQLHQSRWCRGVRIRHVGRPTRELAFQVSPTPFVCCPFKFSWPGACRIYDGCGTVVLLDCASDFHGVNDSDGAIGGMLVMCMHVFGRTLDLSSEGQLLFRTTENVLCTTRASTHRSQSVPAPSRCRWSGQLLRRRSCGVPEGDPAFQSCWLETLVSSLFQMTAIRLRPVRPTWLVRG